MKKIEIAKEWISNNNNVEWTINQLDLYLENNHGQNIQFIYSLINTDKKEFEENGPYKYRNIKKSECLELKWAIINDTLKVVQYGVLYDNNIEVSENTIKKAMKELNFYNTFNNKFINSLNGESENIEIFKRWFIR